MSTVESEDQRGGVKYRAAYGDVIPDLGENCIAFGDTKGRLRSSKRAV